MSMFASFLRYRNILPSGIINLIKWKLLLRGGSGMMRNGGFNNYIETFLMRLCHRYVFVNVFQL